MEAQTGVNEVVVGEVVQLGHALSAVGSEDAAEHFAALNDTHTTTRSRGSVEGRDYSTPINDDVARINQVDIAGTCST